MQVEQEDVNHLKVMSMAPVHLRAGGMRGALSRAAADAFDNAFQEKTFDEHSGGELPLFVL